VAERPDRGLDHGAYVPLIPMYPDADIPVLQISMPDLQPAHLFEIGQRLAPLRDEGVLIMGSGFMTHGLPFVHEYWDGRAGAPEWSVEFDRWAAETLERGDLDALFDFRNRAPGMPYAHRRSSISRRSFVALGAATEPGEAPTFTIEGYWLGLAKRSFQVFAEKVGLGPGPRPPTSCFRVRRRLGFGVDRLLGHRPGVGHDPGK